MCLYIKYSKHPDYKPRISRRDIRCYKIYFINTLFSKKPHLESPYCDKRVLSTTIKAKPCFQSKPELGKINYAIHAYRNIFRAWFRLRKIYQNEPYWQIFTMRIPKGTKYWIGEDGEIAAEKMVFVTDISQYLSKE